MLWRNDNGVGNSYSNIFGGMENIRIAHICCQQGTSDNDVTEQCFQISEGSLLRNLRNPHIPSGRVETNIEGASGGKENRWLRFVKRNRWQIFFWARNIIWKVGRWKNQELRAFIDEFAPDLVFGQLQGTLYLNDIISYVHTYTQKPLMLYAWDDIYSLKQFRLSPLYWIARFAQRRSVRSLVKKCRVLYTIAEEQKKEYAKTLHANTKLLYKGMDFSAEYVSKQMQNPLQMLYTGNLYAGRYATLRELCIYLKEINGDAPKIQLGIYSATPLSDKEIQEISIADTSYFGGKITETEVQKLQTEANILLHIEPMSLKGSLACRLSFSTKLVDYFHKGKCIFAVGSPRCASMQYLKRYDAALAAMDIKDMKRQIDKLLGDDTLTEQYAEKAWLCGAKNHKIQEIQKNLRKDFEEAIYEGCTD